MWKTGFVLALALHGAGLRAEAPRIDAFLTIPVGAIAPGKELRYMVAGSPGARVTLRIPGVPGELPMRETGPGFYQASYRVQAADDPRAFGVAVATLELQGATLTRRNERAFPPASEPPEVAISGLRPREGEQVPANADVELGANFDVPDGSGLVAESVRLVVSGHDLTSVAQVSPSGVSAATRLQPGTHTAEVVARDRAGQEVRRRWHFVVAAP